MNSHNIDTNVLFLLLMIETSGNRGVLCLQDIPFDLRPDPNDVLYAYTQGYIDGTTYTNSDRIFTSVSSTLKGIWYYYKNKEEIEAVAEEKERARRRRI